MPFKDRVDAGRKLAERLAPFRDRADVLLYALPRGGAVLGAEIAKVLEKPFDLFVTRKIGAPFDEEYAVGALAETGDIIWNEDERSRFNEQALLSIVEQQKAEAKRRVDLYRRGRALPDMSGKTVIIVDDGVATGYTMRAAVAAAKRQHADNVIVAVPHGAKDSLEELRKEGAQVIALEEPAWYGAVGMFYRAFPQVEDEEVLALMKSYGVKP